MFKKDTKSATLFASAAKEPPSSLPGFSVFMPKAGVVDVQFSLEMDVMGVSYIGREAHYEKEPVVICTISTRGSSCSATGVARVSPLDNFNASRGMSIAFHRAVSAAILNGTLPAPKNSFSALIYRAWSEKEIKWMRNHLSGTEYEDILFAVYRKYVNNKSFGKNQTEFEAYCDIILAMEALKSI